MSEDVVESSLTEAVMKGNIQLVKQLLDSGVSPDGTGVHGGYPLLKAVKKGYIDMIHLLIQRGADVSVGDVDNDQTLLHVACQAKENVTDVVDTLLYYGANVDAVDCGNNTPLHYAVHLERSGVVDQLIKVGCNLDILNDELMTPLDSAILLYNAQIVGMLIKGGCKLDKSEGHVYDRYHYANSVLYSLYRMHSIENIQLLAFVGYPMQRWLTSSKWFHKSEEMECNFEHNDRDNENEVNTGKNRSVQTQLFLNDLVKKTLTLKQACRVSIRHTMVMKKLVCGGSVEGNIYKLPLPEIMKDFVALKDCDSIP